MYTGNGKGKTTSAIGIGIRAAGSGLKVYMFQFMKGRKYSELNTLDTLKNFTYSQHGRDEFVNKKNPEKIDIEVSSGAIFKGFDFAVDYCNAKASSGGAVRIAVQKELSAKANSGGGIRYKGDAVIKDIDISSGGIVKKAS